MSNDILIYVEFNRNNEIAPVSLQLISKAKELTSKIQNSRVFAQVIGVRQNYEWVINVLGRAGADRVIIANDNRLSSYSAQYHASILAQTIYNYSPAIVLIGATVIGRELAPRISAKIQTGLTADCTMLDIDEEGQLIATRPTFGGNLMAMIACKSNPQMATVRPDTFKINDYPENQPQVSFNWVNIDEIDSKAWILDFEEKFKHSAESLSNANVIVACGKGAATQEGIQLTKKLAECLGGKFAASRATVETGFVNKSYQIGQTGSTVSPDLYIACGISGAVQHTVGMDKSKNIIAINKDPNAPIFRIANYGIVGDVFEILPELIKMYSPDDTTQIMEENSQINNEEIVQNEQ